MRQEQLGDGSCPQERSADGRGCRNEELMMWDFRGEAEDGWCPDEKQMIVDDGEEQITTVRLVSR